ncbi:porin, partial [Herbiconiux daphne]
HGQRHQLRNRQAWAGFDGKDKGALTFGRQMGAIYNVSGMSDVAPEVLSGYTAAPDQGFLQRTDNVAQYKNTFNGVTVTGQYKLAGHGHKSIESGKAIHEGAGYATSIVADNINGSGVGAGAAFSTVESVSGKDTQVYSVGTNYNANNVYLAATHTGGKLTTDKRFRDDEVIGQYNFENGVSPSIGYIDTKTDVRKQYVETGLTYTFNKNVKAAVDAGWGVGQTNDRIIKSGVSYSW